ncbi:MAG: recombinase family protein, partial [Chloroflexota bacterium]
MTRIQRQLFEAGRHRGHDPFGYRSLRDEAGNLVHPRQLVIVPEEAAIVRRIFRELTGRSYAEVAELLTREGLLRRGPWTADSVKDIVRRGRVYRGFVVEKRGREERPGHHEPILGVAQYRATMAAIAARTRAGNKPRPFRHYVLRGLVWCSCGTKMRGEARVQRDTDRRYYRCPKVGCKARRSPAETLEESVLTAIADAVLPDAVIERARAELLARLRAPAVPIPARQRKRLLSRLERLRDQHTWGDLGDAEYQAQRDEVRAALRELPDDDRVRSFDAFRTDLLALPDAIAAASPARREELCRIVVQRVIVDDRRLGSLIWTPPAAPFFDRQRWRPQG